MDRCALFVDAGYVLADGAMAVHGTRQRGSVAWDHAGLVKLLTGLARDRTGLPVLRCYWYEATVEGRRSSEHETLADLPGLKLRLGRIRPGRREGVQTEMHRDLVTLARNRAVSDAVIVSAEEDLAEIVTEVQDLGMRVAVVHITVDGNSTMSRPLRQECDDIVDISGAHLRPFVDLIAGAEPADREEQYSNGSYPARSHEAQSHEARSYEPRSFETPTYQRMGLANGHGAGLGAVTHQGLPAAALPAPPTIYTAPVVEEYQRTADPTGPGLMGRDSMGRDSMGTGSADAGSMGPGSPTSASPTAHPGAASLSGPAAIAPPLPGPAAPAVSPPPAGLSSLAGSSPEAGPPHHFAPSHQAGPSLQAGFSHQAGPSHQADHGVMPGERVGSHGGRGLAPGQPGEPQEADAARNALRPQPAAPSSGRPGAHASQSPMGQASMPQAPLQSPVPQSPGPGDVPFGHHPGEYRSPEQVGPRSGLPVREGPVREGPGLREGMSREGMAAPGAEAGRAAAPAAARFADASGQAQRASAHSGPAQQMPSHQMPAQRMPSQQMPAHQMSAHQMPSQQIPAQQVASQQMPAQQMPFHQMPTQQMPSHQMPAQQTSPHQYQSPPRGQFDGVGPGQMPPPQQFHGSQPGQQSTPAPGSGYSSPHHEQGPYSGPQSAAHSSVPQPVPQPMTVSLADAVQAAHAEGFGFGDAVARDAPALWLEAVLARKPRMPSDLEARLLQGSALPIDSLLHDEVRHSLRRGFWDALERSRR